MMRLQLALGLVCVAVCSAMALHGEDTSLGFLGMRAIRAEQDSQVHLPDIYPEYKRGGSMGFMGMRGKKFDFTNRDLIKVDDLWPMDDFDKRAAGFVGMRGKKLPQNSAFFGMRGKKGPSGFVGMRGKKGPSSGFMGVRGKKSSIQDLDSLLAMLSEQNTQNRSAQYGGGEDVPVSEAVSQ